MKTKTVYVCQQCGYETLKWIGKCPSCGEWNTLSEELRETEKERSFKTNNHSAAKPFRLHEITSFEQKRTSTGIREFDRVLGGGIVNGSLVLIGGDPGIGKSTILLQICGNLGNENNILYVSGEESAHQIKLRADRLKVDCQGLVVMNETDIAAVMEQIETQKPDLVIIDSIQTMSHPDISSAMGSVTQVRECSNLMMKIAKSSGIPIFLVGHVNKDGAIAGPKVMEHIVDVVIYFEGERNLSYRILRTAKNRYGSTNEIGVFEMRDTGLEEVQNPSAELLSGRPTHVSGSCIGCLIEGSRPILCEVQALVSQAGFGNARRMVSGFDFNRCCMLIAVLEKRCGLRFGNYDTYLNVVGGLKMDEPASDLAVCLALASGLTDRPLKDDLIAFGEVGLAGELRSVGNVSQRISEAIQLGFKSCILPSKCYAQMKGHYPESFTLYPASTLSGAFKFAFGESEKEKTNK
ncbi:MAG TPA: DNA repair protein RadA [Oscillospiraceae bacterium]|nr:DNA repair protein RadA [Oscillospiraceae bacterium]HPK34217.1 DNA repair protein RadA [Oscillospiraceae bacterium]HPR74880.1 DNA repair protein RadA [Oscillospiraceae bacterium]